MDLSDKMDISSINYTASRLQMARYDAGSLTLPIESREMKKVLRQELIGPGGAFQISLW